MMHNRSQVVIVGELLICLINSQTRDAAIYGVRERGKLIQIQASDARHRGITRTRFDLLSIKDCSIHMGYHNGKCYRHDSRRCWCLNKKYETVFEDILYATRSYLVTHIETKLWHMRLMGHTFITSIPLLG